MNMIKTGCAHRGIDFSNYKLINLSSADYSDLVLAKSAIDDYLAHSRARGGNAGYMAHVTMSGMSH